MSIFKRGNVYWYHFLHDGQHVQRSTKQGNPRVARQIEAAYRTALAKGEVGITERKRVPSFEEALKAFLAWSKQEHRAKPATHARHVTSSVALLRVFRGKHLDKITVADVEAFKTMRLEENSTVRGKVKGTRKETKKKIQPATVNRELACLRLVFNHAIKGDVPVTNPVRKTGAKAYREQNEQTRVLSYDEQTRYLAKATPFLFDVATLMLETGMRPEEVYRILPENVHLAGGYLFNPYGKTSAARRRVNLTKTAHEVLVRRMALVEQTRDALRRKGEKHDVLYLFPHAADASQPVPKVNNAHDRAVKDSKVARFRLYDLRHTWATRAAQSGVDLVTLAAMLGHSKINMVMRYAHPTQEHQRTAMVRLEEYVAAQRIAEAERVAPQTSNAIQ